MRRAREATGEVKDVWTQFFGEGREGARFAGAGGFDKSRKEVQDSTSSAGKAVGATQAIGSAETRRGRGRRKRRAGFAESAAAGGFGRVGPPGNPTGRPSRPSWSPWPARATHRRHCGLLIEARHGDGEKALVALARNQNLAVLTALQSE